MRNDAKTINSQPEVRSETRGYLKMENSIRCYIFLFVTVTAAMALPMLILGSQCRNAEKQQQLKRVIANTFIMTV